VAAGLPAVVDSRLGLQALTCHHKQQDKVIKTANYYLYLHDNASFP
jgi:hypothetical protein